MDVSDAVITKAGNVFAVARPDGGMADGVEGIWVDDQRHLSRHVLRVDGEPPRPLYASDAAGDVAVHDVEAAGVRLRLERRIHPDGTVGERIETLAGDPAAITLELGADFLAMLALRGHLPRRPSTAGGGPLHFSAEGSDGVVRATAVEATPGGQTDGDVLRFERPRTIELRYRFSASGRRPDPVPAAARMARIEVDGPAVGAVLERAVTDLRTLRSSLDGQPYFAAGVPWYATLFGRDSLLTAGAVLPLAPDVAAHTVRLLAANLGTLDDPEREEEPGKVLHELRVGEAAAPGATPLARYYGTVDATPLLLCLLAEHAEWTGSLELVDELRAEIDGMLAWLDRGGELLTYRQHSPAGLRNQGWKDSPEGVPDERGAPLEPPVALVEAQAYAIRARHGVAAVLERHGERERARALRSRADRHAAALERFWLADRRAFAMALDGEGRPSRALASNQGHLLWAEVLDAARARAVRDALMHPRLFSGWGLRTLAEGEAAHDPAGYHLGAVWPHDTALAAVGLRRYGFHADFLKLTDALLEAAGAFGDHRLPELMAGDARRPDEPPRPYAASCRPQAWAAAAVPQLLLTGLGLRARPGEGRLDVVDPLLPAGVNRLRLHELEVGGSRADLAFERTSKSGSAALCSAKVDGDLQVVDHATA